MSACILVVDDDREIVNDIAILLETEVTEETKQTVKEAIYRFQMQDRIQHNAETPQEGKHGEIYKNPKAIG